MPILSRKSIHSERNCSTVNIPFLECTALKVVDTLSLIEPELFCQKENFVKAVFE